MNKREKLMLKSIIRDMVFDSEHKYINKEGLVSRNMIRIKDLNDLLCGRITLD